MRKSLLVLAVAAVIMIAGTAMADTITGTYGGQTFTANLTASGGVATLSLTGPALWTTEAVAVHVVNGNINNPVTVTLFSASGSGWSGYAGGAPGDNGSNCDGSGQWFCATGGRADINGATFVWHYSGGSTVTPYSVWFSIFNPDGKFIANFSCATGEISDTCGGTKTPEPASLALLGSGLLALGGLIRRRKQ